MTAYDPQTTPITVRTLKSDWEIVSEPDISQIPILFSPYTQYDAKTQMFFAKQQDVHHIDRGTDNGITLVGHNGTRHFKYNTKNSVYTSFTYADLKELYHLFIFVDQESLDSYWKSIRARTDWKSIRARTNAGD
jgi:hypothetical protein